MIKLHVFPSHKEDSYTRLCDQWVAGSSLGRVPLRSNLGQVIYTYAPLSPSSK